MTVAVSTNVQNVWPTRIQVVVTGITVGDLVDVYRSVAGQRTAVRGGHVDSATDTALIVVDAEQPFGVPVSYVAVVDGTEYATSATTYDLPGGKVALTDAITGASAEVAIGAAGDQTYGRDSARMRPAGRNVVVTGPAGQAESSYELVAESTTAVEDLLSLLRTATGATVQIRQPGGYDGVDAYLAVDNWAVRRMNQDGKDEKRLVTIEFAETDGWAPALQARGFTYGDVAAIYTGLTYADAEGDYATYLDAAQGDFS